MKIVSHVCASLLVCGCVGDGQRLELRASELPDEAAMLEISLVGGDEPRTTRLHVPGGRPLRIALHIGDGERVHGVAVLDARGLRLAPVARNGGSRTSSQIGMRVAALGPTSSYFVDVVSPDRL
jgi:hypothetical protein